MDERILRLEEKIAYLERHIVEQDRAMLELTEQVERLRAALLALRERLPESATGGGGEPASPADERPPHY
ncbi:MAG: SlyX family protein [Opitutaceae bacterium]|nr:SlyX family protein [Opitutaceae bacterium]